MISNSIVPLAYSIEPIGVVIHSGFLHCGNDSCALKIVSRLCMQNLMSATRIWCNSQPVKIYFTPPRFRQPLIVTMGKASPATVSKKKKSSTVVAEPHSAVFSGWITVAEFLRKDSKALSRDNQNCIQLIHVLSCAELSVGMQAEVNWYTGGNHYVTLPNAVTEKPPGIYFAKAKHIRWTDLSEEDQGPQTPMASITNLRWLGTRRQFLKIAKERGREVGKKSFGLLMEMLTANYDSSSDAATCGSSCDSSHI